MLPLLVLALASSPSGGGGTASLQRPSPSKLSHRGRQEPKFIAPHPALAEGSVVVVAPPESDAMKLVNSSAASMWPP